MRKGLVLEGGAMLGLFSAGCMDVLMENNIYFDGIVGVSAGACFGVNMASHQIGRSIRYNLEYAKDPRYCSMKNLIQTGDIYGSDFCYHKIPMELDPYDWEAFVESKTRFYSVATDVETGKAHFHRCKTCLGDDLEYIRASASMPLFANIVEIGDRKFLDGGIADSIPLRFMEKKGYDKNVVICTRPRDYRKEKNAMLPVIRVKYAKYPNFIKACAQRHLKYNKEKDYINEQEANGNCFVLCPNDMPDIGHISHDREEMLDTYEAGRIATKAVLPQLLAYLEK